MKRFFLILVLPLIVLTACVCKPENNPDNLYLGETFGIYDDTRALLGEYSYDNCAFEILKDNEEVLVIQTLTINPMAELTLKDTDLLLTVGYKFAADDKERYHSSKDYNLIKNGFDIFEKPVTEKVTYNFCFVIEFEVNGIKYSDVGVTCLAFHQRYLINDYRKQ